MEATELRKKTDILEKKIAVLIDEFIKDVGYCDINIQTDFDFEKAMDGKSKRIFTGLIIEVTV
jgi:hypothetical protein